MEEWTRGVEGLGSEASLMWTLRHLRLTRVTSQCHHPIDCLFTSLQRPPQPSSPTPCDLSPSAVATSLTPLHFTPYILLIDRSRLTTPAVAGPS